MELLSNLSIGFAAVITPLNLGFCFAGVLLGTLIGVLPGIGPVPTMAMLLPMTFGLPPLTAMIMLAGIFYGAQYGGSTTAILVNLPGEASSVITCLDGFEMAKQGRGGAALAISALGSFFAGCVATLVIALFGPALGRFAIKFQPADYFSLMVLGLVAAVVLAHGSVLRAIAMVFAGILLGFVGTDVNTGMGRMTFDVPQLIDGLGFVPLAVGLFGLAEILTNLEHSQARNMTAQRIEGLWPNREERRRAMPAALRGTLLGSLLGIIPGGGATLASFAAYSLEKKLARDPRRFGNGAVEGVAAPESANNAGAQTSFIPMLTLGIPTNAIMALMVGAMYIQGIAPGPDVMTKQPQLFWGLIASMWVGNLMLLVLNLPLIGIWVRLIAIPYRILYPIILILCCMGVYSLNNSPFEVALTVLFGLLGYLFRKLGCEPAPLLMGFILGPQMEENFRRSLLLSRGDPAVFAKEPLSLAFLLTAGILLLLMALPLLRRKRSQAFTE